MAERHERGSVIITTNLGFADWPQFFGDATLDSGLARSPDPQGVHH
ncbi:ATP-binding protein [Solidesulfovibrio magneticus]